jgi:serine/threonine protein kinase
VRISDFGLSKTISSAVDHVPTRPIYGTIGWAAPEYLSPDRHAEQNTMGDVYSFGVILWELLTRETPWEEFNENQVFIKVSKGETLDIPRSCPANLADMMNKCWASKRNFMEISLK